MTDRLARARGTRAKLRLLAHWLAQRMGRGRAMDRAIAWAVGTLDGGYYDQSHMNGELKQLAGISPRQFLAARHPVGDGTTAAG